ncbi:putative acyl- N-acyltransferase [Rosellinia necatrix]|uniref:Putative acyl-N-acyltransferase n=1 Tax=Rosellinia necatrix TaxID=77044 RepID=A0A1W2THL2_ROSNE|nr:putative acyl- N-acyltransferase [Rosellinia necatrix]
MRANEHKAISTSKILLVPYDAHHVGQYHQWMQSDALREATASDLLSLAEEYENQQSWRAASDKLTFIVCRPVAGAPAATREGAGPDGDNDAGPAAGRPAVHAGEDDAPARMVGDVNLFLTACDDDGDGDGGGGRNGTLDAKGEIDIMIAAADHRRKGLGEAAVRAFLRYLAINHDAIMAEYARGVASSLSHTAGSNARLKKLVAKINADNAGSIRLFGNLGFQKQGDPDYFNEVSMVLPDFSPGLHVVATTASGVDPVGYTERFYDRARLKK